MTKWFALALAAALALPLVAMMTGCEASSRMSGCGSEGVSTYHAARPSGCETLTEDRCARSRRIYRNYKLECRQLCEDWDYFWLVDEPSRLTRYYMPHKPR